MLLVLYMHDMHYYDDDDCVVKMIDINECADSAINCSIADNKICTNTDGSYTCNCIPDYFQNEPNGLCKGKYLALNTKSYKYTLMSMHPYWYGGYNIMHLKRAFI